MLDTWTVQSPYKKMNRLRYLIYLFFCWILILRRYIDKSIIFDDYMFTTSIIFDTYMFLQRVLNKKCSVSYNLIFREHCQTLFLSLISCFCNSHLHLLCCSKTEVPSLHGASLPIFLFESTQWRGQERHQRTTCTPKLQLSPQGSPKRSLWSYFQGARGGRLAPQRRRKRTQVNYHRQWHDRQHGHYWVLHLFRCCFPRYSLLHSAHRNHPRTPGPGPSDPLRIPDYLLGSYGHLLVSNECFCA